MKTRPVLVIIITLIIGFFIGMLTSAQIRFHRLRPMRMYFMDNRFREGLYQIIQPDEQQKVKIDQILDKYSKLNSDVQDKFRTELNTNVEAMQKELDQNLTKAQVARLKLMDDRRQNMMRAAMRNHRPDTMRFHRGMRTDGQHRQFPGEFKNPDSPQPPPDPEHDTVISPR